MASRIITQKYNSVRKNARSRGIEFNLSLDEFIQLLHEANGRCCMTKIPFDDSEPNGKRRPFAASLDRIDNDKGYFYDNCRFICTALNLAIGWFGEEVFKRIALSYSAICDVRVLKGERHDLKIKPKGVYPYQAFGGIHYKARIHTKYLSKDIYGFKTEEDAIAAYKLLSEQNELLKRNFGHQNGTTFQ